MQTSTTTSKRPPRLTGGYLVAVALIYLTTACAWLCLGVTVDNRTRDKDERLRSEVGRLWGGTHTHVAPAVTVPAEVTPPPPAPATAPAAPVVAAAAPAATASAAEIYRGGAAPTPPPVAIVGAANDPCRRQVVLEPLRTAARVNLGLEHRRKGLLWYSTYKVDFDGTYGFENATTCAREARLWVPFPASGVAYDEFQVLLDGKELPVQMENAQGGSNGATGAAARVTLAAGRRHDIRVRYRSRGMDRWNYVFGAQAARARNFALVVRTDFDKVDFPAGALSPTAKHHVGGGWELTWQFGNLLSDAGIGVALPQKINPGPLAAEISKFAPISLLFFFFLLLLLSVLQQVPLHPVHYGMLAAAFFSFHLLLVYSADLMPLGAALTLASVVSVALVVSYLRLAVGPRFALLWAGGAQLVYLVLFSLAFLLEGYTGITITTFSIITLFAVMQLTGRIDWAATFGKAPPAALGGDAGAAAGAAPLADQQSAHVFTRAG